MEIDVRHVNRKTLKNYLDKQMLDDDRENIDSDSSLSPLEKAIKRLSSDSEQSEGPDQRPPAKKIRCDKTVCISSIQIQIWSQWKVVLM